METKLFKDDNLPYICTPLTGNTINEILSELSTIVPKKPDIIEWRVDFFSDIEETNKVLAALKEIYYQSNGIPLLFTIRSQREGGQPITLDDNGIIELLCEVCKSQFVAMVDYELANRRDHIERLREAAKNNQKKLVLSYHNFKDTPTKAEIIEFLSKMAFYNADVAKVAFMPNNYQDVITLLEATRAAKEVLPIPLITISMGDIGVMSRVLGWLYGSSVTFAVGEKSSAPGQISIETLKELITTVKSAP